MRQLTRSTLARILKESAGSASFLPTAAIYGRGGAILKHDSTASSWTDQVREDPWDGRKLRGRCSCSRNEELVNYLTALKVTTRLHHIVYESEVERAFASGSTSVRTSGSFVKLPTVVHESRRQSAPTTPTGPPQHGRNGDVSRARDKSTPHLLKLRTSSGQGRCGQKHFETLEYLRCGRVGGRRVVRVLDGPFDVAKMAITEVFQFRVDSPR